MRIIRSQPSLMPRFSAAMDGWRIHCCSRCTASSWRCSISFQTGVKSGSAAEAKRGKAMAAAPAAAVVRKSLRFMAPEHKEIQICCPEAAEPQAKAKPFNTEEQRKQRERR